MKPKQTDRHADSTQLARQWALIRVLSGSNRAFTVKELADQLSTSKSTIERDLATIETQFSLVEDADGKQKKRYRIAPQVRALETIQFGLMELLALHAAQGALHFAAGAPFYDDLQAVARKVRGHLGDRYNGGLDAMARVFMPHARRYVDYAPFADTIDTVVDAIAQHKECTVAYHAAWKEKPRSHTAQPLKLLFHEGALYLFARLNGKATVTVLAVHRIQSIELTAKSFTPPRVDLDAIAHKAFGMFIGDEEKDVEVLFDAKIARMVEERIFHPDEIKERLPDGRLRFRLRTGARWEVVSWVLRFGGDAELVAPTEWRTQAAEAGKNLMDRHAHR